jgi:hypothetical protein
VSAVRQGAQVVVGDGQWLGTVISAHAHQGDLWSVARGEDGVVLPVAAKDLLVIGYVDAARE